MRTGMRHAFIGFLRRGVDRNLCISLIGFGEWHAMLAPQTYEVYAMSR